MTDAHSFVKESNAIDGIHRDPTDAEMAEYFRFMSLEGVGIKDMQKFVSVYRQNALLREVAGLSVWIGSYRQPSGGAAIKKQLIDLLRRAERTRQSAFETHKAYETLHPFTDGNGRSGRMLWRWQMKDIKLGFLHSWYYQTLEYGRAP